MNGPRAPRAAPRERVEAPRRGRVVGRYCLKCHSVYPSQRAVHRGRPIQGRDHIGSPCPYEGSSFAEGAGWWDQAVEVLPPPPPAEAEPEQPATPAS